MPWRTPQAAVQALLQTWMDLTACAASAPSPPEKHSGDALVRRSWLPAREDARRVAAALVVPSLAERRLDERRVWEWEQREVLAQAP